MTKPIGTFLRHNEQYPQDEIRAIKPTHQYSGTITHSSETNTSSIRHIDNSIVFTSVSNRIRRAALEQFNFLDSQTNREQQLHKTERNKGIAASCLGIAIGSVSIHCLAASLLNPLLAVAIAVGSIAAVYIGISQWKYNQKAINELNIDKRSLQNQKLSWNDPINSIIRQRESAGKEGFEYVYKNNLKGTIVHPEEVANLWARDFNKLISLPLDPVKIFKEKNLFSKACIEYSLNENESIQIAQSNLPVSQLYKMGDLFEKSREAFNNFEKEIAHEFTAINNRHCELTKEIALLRAQWLIPAEKIYLLASQEAENLYHSNYNALLRERDLEIAAIERAHYHIVKDPSNMEERNYKVHLDKLCHNAIKACRSEFELHPTLIAFRDAYEKDRRMNLFLFNQSRQVVDNFFDRRIKEIENETAQAKQQVGQQRTNGYQHFSNLLERIFHPRGAQDLEHLSISSPPVVCQWNISDSVLQLNWDDVYGKIPTFHSSFAKDISENSWNLFWGDHGLRRFAAHPIHSWKTLFKDREYFPFQDDWFHVQRYSRQPRPVFCRQIIVPPPPSFRRPVEDQRIPGRRPAASLRSGKVQNALQLVEKLGGEAVPQNTRLTNAQKRTACQRTTALYLKIMKDVVPVG